MCAQVGKAWIQDYMYICTCTHAHVQTVKISTCIYGAVVMSQLVTSFICHIPEVMSCVHVYTCLDVYIHVGVVLCGCIVFPHAPPLPPPSLPPSPGLPLAPVELEVRGDTAHQLTLSWGPPFTLPGETLSYSLLIEDLDTGHTETVNTLSDTVYTHNVSEAEALACHSFLFSVSSVNDVGPSLISSSVQAVHPSGRPHPDTLVVLLCQLCTDLPPSSPPSPLSGPAPGALGAVEARVMLDGQAQTGSQATVQLTLQVVQISVTNNDHFILSSSCCRLPDLVSISPTM